ncbi:MAG: elongation factor 1-beta [Candidatus Micrarchaeota archaeon]
MGRVVALIKVFPESMEVFEELKENIRKEVNPARIDEEPVAFGFKALKVTVVMADESGSGDIEEKIKKIKGASEVEVVDIGRIS